MTRGYVSDVDGDDTVMELPDCTISFDANRLSREQAVTLGELGTVTEPWALHDAKENKSFDHTQMGDITFHLTLEQAVMALMSVGIMDNGMIENGPDKETE
jgi:hypothetical protein